MNGDYPMRVAVRLAMLGLTWFAAASTPALGQVVPNGFQIDSLVQTGLSSPADFTFLPDGRALIACRTGEVCLYAGGPAVQIGVVPQVLFGNERGLLSIEADPLFDQNGYIYVFYTSNADSFLHLDRYTVLGDLHNATSTNCTLDASSRRVVLDVLPHATEFHNGGSLRFGPDGMLYLSVGDDSNGCDSQSPSSGRGCILRMDLSGLPPGSSGVAPPFSQICPGTNPLVANQDLSQLVVAHGLRNPFRMEIDWSTGNLYIGDVGGGLEEEIDEYVFSAGVLPLRNYGWPWFEGDLAVQGPCPGTGPTAVIPPLRSLSHSSGWGVIIQGPRYRNQGGPFDFGPAYEGRIFAAEFGYAFGWMMVLEDGPSGWGPMPPVPGQPNGTQWCNGIQCPTSIRQGPDGALYMTRDVPWSTGAFDRIRPSVPASTVVSVSGSGQVAASGDPFSQPLIVRVQDGAGSPLVGVPVTFRAFGPVALSPSVPVATDSQGRAQVFATAGATGGTVSVSASAQGVPGEANFSLFTRKLGIAHTSSLAVVTIRNVTEAIPAQVPFIVMLALPGAPPWNAPFGPVCTDPASPLTIVIEDALGIFGGFSLSGAGSTGAPGLTRVYPVPPGLLTGLQLNFQAIGVDPVEGWFRTDCVNVQF